MKEEKDQNEITYDAKQLQEIEANRKVKVAEMLKNRKARSRCRNLCGSLRI